MSYLSTAQEPGAALSLSILLVEDDLKYAGFLSRFLKKEGHDVHHVATGEEALEAFEQRAPDIVLLDLFLGQLTGLEVLEKLKQLDEAAAVIVVTGHASVETAVEAMQLGALDYITKPVDLEALALKLRHTRQMISMRSDLDYLLAREQRSADFKNFIGSCQAMQAVYQKIREVAKTHNTTVLITGESGTGKELVAQAIHSLSSRSDRPLMQIDCTSIPLTLLESELFGHERGAFTGAERMKKGLIELANGGTVLLDEIGDMALELQGKFLRVLQERQFRRVGGARDIRFDVRVIAATNQQLDQLCEQGRFRSELLYRLKVFQIEVPPLRERGDDIGELARAFTRQFAQAFRKPVRGIDKDAMGVLMSYPFPGNVRELRNLIEQAVILAQGEHITRELLSLPAPPPTPPQDDDSAPQRLSLEALGERPLQAAERELIRQAMQQAGGNKKRAAELLGISRFALQRRIEKLALGLME